MGERKLALGLTLVAGAFVLTTAGLLAWVRAVEREVLALQLERDALLRQGGPSKFVGGQEGDRVRGALGALTSVVRAAVANSREDLPTASDPAELVKGKTTASPVALADGPAPSSKRRRTHAPRGPALAGDVGAVVDPPLASGDRSYEAPAGEASDAGEAEEDLSAYRASLQRMHANALAADTRRLSLSPLQRDRVWEALQSREEDLVALQRKRKEISADALELEAQAIETRLRARISGGLTTEQRLIFDPPVSTAVAVRK
ncbi:MAG: hypothetical protein HYZ53_09290 [Planctomycetes bacterium]|nr:hypothetical protein [Planctomycetota bacterium]